MIEVLIIHHDNAINFVDAASEELALALAWAIALDLDLNHPKFEAS